MRLTKIARASGCSQLVDGEEKAVADAKARAVGLLVRELLMHVTITPMARTGDARKFLVSFDDDAPVMIAGS